MTINNLLAYANYSVRTKCLAQVSFDDINDDLRLSPIHLYLEPESFRKKKEPSSTFRLIL